MDIGLISTILGYIGVFIITTYVLQQIPYPLTSRRGFKEKSHHSISETDFSYELYVPESYSEEENSPLVVCLSPNGEGDFFSSALYPAAEEHGFVVLGSNDFASNRPSAEFLPRLYSAIEDAKKNLNIDEERIYLCGFSGGAVATYVAAYFRKDYFRGILANSGTIHKDLYNIEKLRDMGIKRAALLHGRKDKDLHTYLENDLDWLSLSGIDATIIEFNSGHTLAPQDKFIEAFEWLEN